MLRRSGSALVDGEVADAALQLVHVGVFVAAHPISIARSLHLSAGLAALEGLDLLLDDAIALLLNVPPLLHEEGYVIVVKLNCRLGECMLEVVASLACDRRDADGSNVAVELLH